MSHLQVMPQFPTESLLPHDFGDLHITTNIKSTVENEKPLYKLEFVVPIKIGVSLYYQKVITEWYVHHNTCALYHQVLISFYRGQQIPLLYFDGGAVIRSNPVQTYLPKEDHKEIAKKLVEVFISEKVW